MGILKPPLRVVVGGLIGLGAFCVDAFATIVRFLLMPSLAERATAGTLLAMFLFAFLFIATGACAGYLWTLRIKSLRFIFIGALVGALVWSYLTATWPVTAKPGAVVPPQTSVLASAAIGACAGALGGWLLFAISGLRGLGRLVLERLSRRPES